MTEALRLQATVPQQDGAFTETLRTNYSIGECKNDSRLI